MYTHLLFLGEKCACRAQLKSIKCIVQLAVATRCNLENQVADTKMQFRADVLLFSKNYKQTEATKIMNFIKMFRYFFEI